MSDVTDKTQSLVEVAPGVTGKAQLPGVAQGVTGKCSTAKQRDWHHPIIRSDLKLLYRNVMLHSYTTGKFFFSCFQILLITIY